MLLFSKFHRVWGPFIVFSWIHSSCLACSVWILLSCIGFSLANIILDLWWGTLPSSFSFLPLQSPILIRRYYALPSVAVFLSVDPMFANCLAWLSSVWVIVYYPAACGLKGHSSSSATTGAAPVSVYRYFLFLSQAGVSIIVGHPNLLRLKAAVVVRFGLDKLDKWRVGHGKLQIRVDQLGGVAVFVDRHFC